MAKVGRAAYAHAKERVTIVSAASTLTANDSGETIVLNSSTGFTTTLPAAKAGMYFRFVIAVGSTDGNLKVAAASGEYFYGTVFVLSGQDDKTAVQNVLKATASASADNFDHLVLDGDSAASGGGAGNVIDCYCVEDGGWVISATLVTQNIEPDTIAVITGS